MLNGLKVITFLYTLFIVVASLGKFVIGVFPKQVPNSDKIGHFIAYAGFSFIWGFYFLKLKKFTFAKTIVTSLVWSIFFGILMEVCQWLFTSYRQPDYYDILANSAGALIGLLIFGIFFDSFKKSSY